MGTYGVQRFKCIWLSVRQKQIKNAHHLNNTQMYLLNNRAPKAIFRKISFSPQLCTSDSKFQKNVKSILWNCRHRVLLETKKALLREQTDLDQQLVWINSALEEKNVSLNDVETENQSKLEKFSKNLNFVRRKKWKRDRIVPNKLNLSFRNSNKGSFQQNRFDFRSAKSKNLKNPKQRNRLNCEKFKEKLISLGVKNSF